MKRKRAKGGGRKPRGEFSDLKAIITMRMPSAMRESLETKARESGRSLTQEILIRLSESLQNVGQLKLIQTVEAIRNDAG